MWTFHEWLRLLETPDPSNIKVITIAAGKKHFSSRIRDVASSTRGYSNPYLAFLPVDYRPYWKPSDPYVEYEKGWNQSWHNAIYDDPMLFAFGDTEEDAVDRLKKSLNEFLSKQITDPSTERFRRREFVRSGD